MYEDETKETPEKSSAAETVSKPASPIETTAPVVQEQTPVAEIPQPQTQMTPAEIEDEIYEIIPSDKFISEDNIFGQVDEVDIEDLQHGLLTLEIKGFIQSDANGYMYKRTQKQRPPKASKQTQQITSDNLEEQKQRELWGTELYAEEQENISDQNNFQDQQWVEEEEDDNTEWVQEQRQQEENRRAQQRSKQQREADEANEDDDTDSVFDLLPSAEKLNDVELNESDAGIGKAKAKPAEAKTASQGDNLQIQTQETEQENPNIRTYESSNPEKGYSIEDGRKAIIQAPTGTRILATYMWESTPFEHTIQERGGGQKTIRFDTGRSAFLNRENVKKHFGNAVRLQIIYPEGYEPPAQTPKSKRSKTAEKLHAKLKTDTHPDLKVWLEEKIHEAAAPEGRKVRAYPEELLGQDLSDTALNNAEQYLKERIKFFDDHIRVIKSNPDTTAQRKQEFILARKDQLTKSRERLNFKYNASKFYDLKQEISRMFNEKLQSEAKDILEREWNILGNVN